MRNENLRAVGHLALRIGIVSSVGAVLFAALIVSCFAAYGDEPAPGTPHALHESLMRAAARGEFYAPTKLSVDRETHRDRAEYAQHGPTVEQLMSDLDRLAGPVCPHDQLRAIEHLRMVRDGDAVVMTSMHDGWADGIQWIRVFGAGQPVY